jgi:DNA polymerase-3 subunit delta'
LGRETQKKFLQFCIEMFRQALMMNYETKALVYFEPKSKIQVGKFCPFKWQ